eukprot:356565-Chlamydomonas_euryale.AAC.8
MGSGSAWDPIAYGKRQRMRNNSTWDPAAPARSPGIRHGTWQCMGLGSARDATTPGAPRPTVHEFQPYVPSPVPPVTHKQISHARSAAHGSLWPLLAPHPAPPPHTSRCF